MLSRVGHDYLEFARGRFYIASYAAQLSQRIFLLSSLPIAARESDRRRGIFKSRPDNQSSR